MTVSARHSHVRRRSPEAATHLFLIGQIVRMKSRFGISPRTAEFFRITGTLPPRDNSPQYRIRSGDERHERVATQETLEAAGFPPTGNGTALFESIFLAMAKGQKRSNREHCKPKQEKAPPKPENSFANRIKLAANANAPRRKGGN